MRPETDFWQSDNNPNNFSTVQKGMKKGKKHAWCLMPWRTINQVLPIWARSGGGVVRRDGGDWSHWQWPLGGGHGEGAHHGGRTRPPPFVCCRLTQYRKRKTETQKNSALKSLTNLKSFVLFIFLFKVFGKSNTVHTLLLYLLTIERKGWMVALAMCSPLCQALEKIMSSIQVVKEV